jgi:hypothetical protein
MFYILYPEKRVVGNDTILHYYLDAVENGEVEDMGAVNAVQAAKALHEAGVITLTNKKPHCSDCGEE